MFTQGVALGWYEAKPSAGRLLGVNALHSMSPGEDVGKDGGNGVSPAGAARESHREAFLPSIVHVKQYLARARRALHTPAPVPTPPMGAIHAQYSWETGRFLQTFQQCRFLSCAALSASPGGLNPM